MSTREELLDAYDTQLRTEAETPSATDVSWLGPIRLVTFDGGRGFVTYPHLATASAKMIAGWVEQALEHYRGNPSITRVEWKTRGHDHAPGLHDALIAHGFVPGETESIMIGEAHVLDIDVPLPDGVQLRCITSHTDVHAMNVMLDIAFGSAIADDMTRALMARLARPDGMELWVAETKGQMISAGRLEPVADSDFAGIWGGATLPEWRSRGIYRALTAARARSALAMGKALMHSDSTEYSRPILERSGLVEVSSTTPYHWYR